MSDEEVPIQQVPGFAANGGSWLYDKDGVTLLAVNGVLVKKPEVIEENKEMIQDAISPSKTASCVED